MTFIINEQIYLINIIHSKYLKKKSIQNRNTVANITQYIIHFIIIIICILVDFLGYGSITQGENLNRIKLILAQSMEEYQQLKWKWSMRHWDTDMKALRRSNVRGRQWCSEVKVKEHSEYKAWGVTSERWQNGKSQSFSPKSNTDLKIAYGLKYLQIQIN